MNKKVLIIILGLTTLVGCSGPKKSSLVYPENVFGISQQTFADACRNELGKFSLKKGVWICEHSLRSYIVRASASSGVAIEHSLSWSNQEDGFQHYKNIRKDKKPPDETKDIGSGCYVDVWENDVVGGFDVRTDIVVCDSTVLTSSQMYMR